MSRDINDGDLDVMETADPIGFEVRQISPRVSAKLKHLYVISQLCECAMHSSAPITYHIPQVLVNTFVTSRSL